MLLALVLVLLACAGGGTSKVAPDDEIFRTLGFSVPEAAFFYDSFDKRKVRERCALLDPPPFNRKRRARRASSLTRLRAVPLNENHYAGAVVGGERHGVGVLTIGGPQPGQHDTHSGLFKRGRRHGYAVVEVWEDGESTVYSGEYWNDQQHGHGVLQSMGGTHDVYDGEWLFGSQWGQGRYTSDKWHYAGEWRAGEPHGQGVETDLVNGIKHEVLQHARS